MSAREPHLTRDGHWVGASVPRKEDLRLLAGRGRFVDDITPAGTLHVQFVRSTVAHGHVLGVDLSRVRALPGVVAAFDAKDLALEDIEALLDRPREEFAPTRMPVLAGAPGPDGRPGKVRFVGEPLAVVVATDPYLAEDGCELAVVDYEPLPAVTSWRQVLADPSVGERASAVHDDVPDNVLVDVAMFATEGIDQILADAHLVVTVEVESGRQNALPLETRGAVAEWDERAGSLVLHTATQVPHQVRTVAARCLGVAESSVRVVVPDMGGGFGIKCVVGREEIAVAAVAHRLRRPVKWIEDRKDALTASFLAREQHYRVAGAFDADGHLLALDGDVVCDMGAYSCYPFTAAIEPLMACAEMPSVYRVPAYRVRGRAVASTKAPTAPYRGVSRPQYVMVMERLMDRAARRLGMDPVEIRRRNVITTFPYTGVNLVTYDAGSYLESLELAETTLREEGWYEYREQASRADRFVGIGYSCFSERTGYGSGAFAQRKMRVVPGFDVSEIRMDLSGHVTVTSGTVNHGQSHETTMAQIVADVLGLDVDEVTLVQGDTDRILYGWGTFASRSVVIGGSAVGRAAAALERKLVDLAAHLLGARPEQLHLAHHGVRPIDPADGPGLDFTELAEVAYLRSHLLPKSAEPGLSATAGFDVAGDGTFSNATHACVVELDPGTGEVRILRYVCVEDCGVAINPRVVEGQARGGIAQGIAGALFEEVVYDASGEPLCASLLDYLVPTAAEIPDVLIRHLETPCAFTETGAKGAGEGGTIGAPAATLNAVNDALRATGVELDATPVRPEAVHAALSHPGHATARGSDADE